MEAALRGLLFGGSSTDHDDENIHHLTIVLDFLKYKRESSEEIVHYG